LKINLIRHKSQNNFWELKLEKHMFTFARLDRLPPYVFATVNEIKMEARRAGQDIIDLGMGNPDLGTPQHIVDKLIEAAQKPHNHRYSASMGITKLRMAIAGWYDRRFGVSIDPDKEAIATIGVKEGMSHGKWIKPHRLEYQKSQRYHVCVGKDS
jgi:DNA-binding transcriptional MocR family regulator